VGSFLVIIGTWIQLSQAPDYTLKRTPKSAIFFEFYTTEIG